MEPAANPETKDRAAARDAYRRSWWSRHGFASLISFSAGALVTWWAMGGADQPSRPAANPSQAAPSAPAVSIAMPTPPPLFPGAVTESTGEQAVTLGNTYYDQRRWTDAIAQYQMALAKGVDNPDVRTDLGNCFRFVGMPEKALEQYRLAQGQDPRHEHSLFNTATLYSEVLGNVPKAVEVWRVYEERFPESLDTPRIRQFLSQNPRMVAALQGAAPAPASSPGAPVSSHAAPPVPANAELMDWMKSEQAPAAR